MKKYNFMTITRQFSEICSFTTLKGDYELKNVGLVEFVASHSFNVSPKTVTGNGNLQPEIEINEYSSSEKLLE